MKRCLTFMPPFFSLTFFSARHPPPVEYLISWKEGEKCHKSKSPCFNWSLLAMTLINVLCASEKANATEVRSCFSLFCFFAFLQMIDCRQRRIRWRLVGIEACLCITQSFVNSKLARLVIMQLREGRDQLLLKHRTNFLFSFSFLLSLLSSLWIRKLCLVDGKSLFFFFYKFYKFYNVFLASFCL